MEGAAQVAASGRRPMPPWGKGICGGTSPHHGPPIIGGGGGGQDQRPGPCCLVLEGEEHNGHEDQHTELSGQRVAEVYQDGGE